MTKQSIDEKEVTRNVEINKNLLFSISQNWAIISTVIIGTVSFIIGYTVLQVKAQANTDGLTNLQNRVTIDEQSYQTSAVQTASALSGLQADIKWIRSDLTNKK